MQNSGDRAWEESEVRALLRSDGRAVAGGKPGYACF